MADRYTTPTAVFNKSGLTTSEIDLTVNTDIIEDSEAELDMITGRRWDDANALIEFLSGPTEDQIGRQVPNFFSDSFGISTGTGAQFNLGRARSISINKYPILSITGFARLNKDATVAKEFDTLTTVDIAAGTTETDDYWLEMQFDEPSQLYVANGRIIMKNEDIIPGVRNYRVTYTYGYVAVPTTIRALASAMAGIRAWVAFTGGQYDRITSYSVPEQSVTKNDIYARAQQNIERLQAEVDQLLDRIGRRSGRIFFATGAQNIR